MISFKLATNEFDIDSILQLMPLYFEEDHLEFQLPRARSAVTAMTRNPDLGQIWLILREQQVIGYMAICFGFSLEFGGRDAFVDELFVTAPYRGQGIGSQALEHAKIECARANVTALRLEVTKDNHRAKKLYQNLGFQDFQRSLLVYEIKK